MPHSNDCINTVLGPGHINDLLVGYYQTNGAVSDDINDAAYEFLVAQGIPKSSVNDMWRAFYTAQGATGSLSDMKNYFWCVKGGIII